METSTTQKTIAVVGATGSQGGGGRKWRGRHGLSSRYWATISGSLPPGRSIRRAIWAAAAPGTSTITATGTVICPSGQACIMLALLFTTTVVVAP